MTTTPETPPADDAYVAGLEDAIRSANEAETPPEAPAPSAVIRASTLRELLEAIVGFADGPAAPDVLASVRIRTTPDEQIVLAATDRYRIGVLRDEHIRDHVGVIDVLVHRTAVEALIDWLPDREQDEDGNAWATLRRSGGRFSVQLTNQSRYATDFTPAFSVATVVASYPPVERLVRQIAEQEPGITQAVGFNPRFLADFAKVGRPGDQIRFWGGDPAKGMAFAVGDYFIGALMPVRHYDEQENPAPWPTFDTDVWAPILGEPLPAKDEKKDADQ